MKSNIIDLQPLYDFAWNDRAGEALLLTSEEGRQFSKTVDKCLAGVSEQQGFYMWGHYDLAERWVNLYIGKAGPGKTAHLKNRIMKELKADRCIFWEPILPERLLMEHCRRSYPKNGESYALLWERALKRA